MSTDKSSQKQHFHNQREHAEWLEKLHRWKAEHGRAEAKLTKVLASIKEHEAEIEEHLGAVHRHEQHIERHERVIAQKMTKKGKTNGESTLDQDAADSHKDFDKTHREIRVRLKKMDKVHQRTIAVLDETLDKLRDVEASAGTVEKLGDEASDQEKLHEADLESFPASDPPSFNPGHT